MHICIITANYSPILDPNAQRYQALAEYWTANGHDVTVICTARSFLPKSSTIGDVKVYRIGSYTLRDKIADILKLNKSRRGTEGKGTKSPGFLEKLADFIWRNHYWPDGATLWYRPATRFASKILQANPPDMILSVCWPFTAHRIALHLKKQFPNSYWIADYQDPFSISKDFTPNNFAKYEILNKSADLEILQWADLITFTCKQAMQSYEKYFSSTDILTKSAVIPPLIHHGRLAKVKLEDKDKIKLGYFGALYTKIREPKILIESMEYLASKLANNGIKLELTIAGIDPIFKSEIVENLREIEIHWLGNLASKDLIAAMQIQEILLSIGNNTDYHLPSKSVELLVSGKPILHLQQIKNDPILQIFEAAEGIFKVYDNLDVAADWVLQQHTDPNQYDRTEQSKRFTIDQIAPLYLKGFTEIK
ncbi:MAG: hypothetical protein ABIV51_10585 [Saprospiraceae bacterium]